VSKRRPLGYNPAKKIQSVFHVEDPTGEEFITEEIQDVTDIVLVNQAEYNAHDERAPFKGDFVKVGQIPEVVWAELVRKGIANDNDALLKWLDDPDNRAFRTRPGRLS
jgi:hypothetical protein